VVSACLLAGAYLLDLALSRVYLNEHWSSDVVGGLLLGLAAGLAVPAVPRHRRHSGCD